MRKFKVEFTPDNKAVEVPEGTTVLAAAISCGIQIKSVCGAEGTCGRCRVVVKSGSVLSSASAILLKQEKESGVCLACQSLVHSDLLVQIPAESRFEPEPLKNIYEKSEGIESIESPYSVEEFKQEPLSLKKYLELPKPSINDSLSDLDRLYREISRDEPIAQFHTGLTNIRQLGEILRDSGWNVTVTLSKRSNAAEIIQVEPGDTSSRNFAVAFDIGTTTISGQLVDLNARKVLATRATYNRQANFGSDVITRIIYAKDAAGLEKLHGAVTETINLIIKELAGQENVSLNDITAVVCTGNTTMVHLLLRIDPSFIRKEPYIPTLSLPPALKAAEAGININPHGLLYCIPAVASYVGGDTTSGVLSSGLYREKELSLLIDIGTNGEIALGCKDFMVACAASAGPAFEGSGVSCGMRACSGAIQRVEIEKRNLALNLDVIGKVKPSGICGSGYISLISQMLSAGVIDKSGKVILEDERRVRQGDSGKEFIVVFQSDSAIGKDIFITEADIENLKRAKAAIYSAASILARHMDIPMEGIRKVFVSGGFGTSLDIESAIRIGLLPDFKRERFEFIGNSALAGAREALLSYEALKESEKIAGKITYFDLSSDPGYMDEYMAALFFPHTDILRFPSLK